MSDPALILVVGPGAIAAAAGAWYGIRRYRRRRRAP